LTVGATIENSKRTSIAIFSQCKSAALSRINSKQEILSIVLGWPTSHLIVVLPSGDWPVARVVRDVGVDVVQVGSTNQTVLRLLDLAAREPLDELLEVTRRAEDELEEIDVPVKLEMETDGEQ
jgi:seryl-tRNA(Sec) selenium transferase